MVDTTRHAGLGQLSGFPFPVGVSHGLEAIGEDIAERCARAYRFLGETLDFRPPVAVLVLSREDWTDRAAYPVYGMPHCADGNLIVAGQDNDLWRGFVELIAASRPDGLEELRTVYGRADGQVDLSPFFELLSVHELAHLFHGQVPCRFPRLWLMELFVNLCLHAYVAAAEPHRLPILETFPRVMSRLPPDGFDHRTLAAFEAHYTELGPQNYGWYQCRFHAAARRVYEVGGAATVWRLWDAFVLNDEQLAERLRVEVDPEAARVVTGWDGAESAAAR